MPNGELSIKSFGAIVSTSGIASSFTLASRSIKPDLMSSAGWADVRKPPWK